MKTGSSLLKAQFSLYPSTRNQSWLFLRGGDQNQIIEWHTSAKSEIIRTDIK